MRSIRQAIAGLTLLAVGGFAAPAGAQTQPDFWLVSTKAAADDGIGSQIAPLILGNAWSYARRHDPAGVRQLLSRLQLMLAYVALDQFELYKSNFGIPNMKIDRSKFDKGLKDYIPTARALEDLYYTRWKSPRPEDKGVRFEALGYGSDHYAEIELALREDLAGNDVLGRADALSYRGLVFAYRGQTDSDKKKARQDTTSAVDTFRDSLHLFEQVRRERFARSAVDRAFDLRPEVDKTRNAAWQTRGVIENVIGSSDEHYLPTLIVKALVSSIGDAIDDGDGAKAEEYIKFASDVDLEASRNDVASRQFWPCHSAFGGLYYWQAALNARRIDYLRKFKPDATSEMDRYFKLAKSEWIYLLELTAYSQGMGAPILKDYAGQYSEFLKKYGTPADVAQADADLKSSTSMDIGSGGPQDWQAVLNCPERSL